MKLKDDFATLNEVFQKFDLNMNYHQTCKLMNVKLDKDQPLNFFIFSISLFTTNFK